MELEQRWTSTPQLNAETLLVAPEKARLCSAFFLGYEWRVISMEFTQSLLPIFVFAGMEELIKLGLVVAFRKTQFRVQSYFLFFALESISKMPGVYDHTLELGAGSLLAAVGTLSLIVASTSFHIFTSLLYAKAHWIWLAVLYCTLVHFTSNFITGELPALSLYPYILLGWPLMLIEIAFLVVYYLSDRYMRPNRPH